MYIQIDKYIQVIHKKKVLHLDIFYECKEMDKQIKLLQAEIQDFIVITIKYFFSIHMYAYVWN